MHTTKLSHFGLMFLLVSCGSSSPGKHSSPTPATGRDATSTGRDDNEFVTRKSDTAAEAHGASPSKIKPTKTEAAVRFIVVDKSKEEPIQGIVISLQAPDGRKFYTKETDELGFGEVLVPVGQSYDIVYLSLGRKDVTAKVTVRDEPFQNIKLTLRYKPRPPAPAAKTATAPDAAPEPVFRLDGVNFASGSAKLLPESYDRLDSVVEYMTYKESARIEISGHTDNVGKAKKNKALSEARANACRDYLISKGIDGGRVEAVGYGAEQPVAPNDTEEGRRQNRRIEAREL